MIVFLVGNWYMADSEKNNKKNHEPSYWILGNKEQCFGMKYIYSKILFVVYLKIKFNWASCILSGDPIL